MSTPEPAPTVSDPRSHIAVAAVVVAGVNLVVYGFYRLLVFVVSFQWNDALVSALGVAGLIAIVPFLAQVVLGVLGLVHAKVGVRRGRGSAGIALGAGVVFSLLWFLALVNALKASFDYGDPLLLQFAWWF